MHCICLCTIWWVSLWWQSLAVDLLNPKVCAFNNRMDATKLSSKDTVLRLLRPHPLYFAMTCLHIHLPDATSGLRSYREQTVPYCLSIPGSLLACRRSSVNWCEMDVSEWIILPPPPTGLSMCARHHSKHFICMNLFNPYNH